LRRLLPLVAVLLVPAWLAWLDATKLPVRALGAPAVTLEVPPGSSVDGVARRLHELGLARHPLVFRALVRLRGAGAHIKAGEYVLDGPLTLEQILERLMRGETARRDVTFPEGRNMLEMAALAAEQAGVERDEFLAAARDPTPVRDLDPLAEDLEGYLFPDTYDVPRTHASAAALVARMVGRFRAVITPELARVRASSLSLREVVTLASLVELETARAEERPRIARVFLNRLRRGMPLQTDPTVIYALRRAGRYDGNIRKADLQIDSPYNTYRRAGLPPGPIASPGREALVAVLAPAGGDELYFVSRNDGSHHFSRTLAEHERAVDVFQRGRRRGRPNATAAP
jgi:UPF0755 protein